MFNPISKEKKCFKVVNFYCRDHSLSTMALLNSAKKAFLKAKVNSPSASGMKTRRKSCLVTENKSAEMENKSADIENKSEEGKDETAPLTVRVIAVL